MAGIAATYVDADTFTLVGDVTGIFIAGRRVKCDCGVDGLKYGTILSSAFTTLTTVNLSADSNTLTSNLSGVYYGIIGGGAENQSMPLHDHDGLEGSGGFAHQIKQIVTKNITTVLFDVATVIDQATTPTSTSGVAFNSQAITLKDAASKVRIQCTIPCDTDNDGAASIAVISRSTTVVVVGAGYGKKEIGGRQIVIDCFDTPGSVGPHTYAIRVGTTENNSHFNRTEVDATPWGGAAFTANCNITLTEITF